MDYVTFSIIIDDIVYPDGHTQMGVLGGGGPQSAFGMRLWSDSVGLVARLGNDLPNQMIHWLNENNINQAGISTTNLPTPRAWQVLEDDGRRTQVWRVPTNVIQAHLRRKLDWIPNIYRHAKGYHLGVHPLDADLDFISAVHNLGSVLSVELFKPAERQLNYDEFAALLSDINIFSLNLEEAISVTGKKDPAKIMTYLLSAGANTIALRMGKDGSFVASRDASPKAFHIPAINVSPINPVGAGNAYCGGFLVGWFETKDVITAGIYGSVAASLLIENENLPIITHAIRKKAISRFEMLKPLVVTVPLE